MTWTVDTVPWALKPLVWFYGIVAASLFWLFLTVWRVTLNVRIEGQLDSPIQVLWHQHLVLYFLIHKKFDPTSCWMQHPALYMKPIHLLLQWKGVRKLAFGSSGSKGRAALSHVIAHVNSGGTTVICPDGPAGPPMTIKKGVFILAKENQSCVNAISFQCEKPIYLPTWDRKIIPLPFSTVRVRINPSIQACPDKSEVLQQKLSSFLAS